MRAVLVLAGLSFGVVPTTIGADDPPKKGNPQEAIPAAVTQHLRDVKGAERGTLKRVSDEPLRVVFPKAEFASLQFRKYPSELVPQTPLKSNNVFATRDDKVVRISTEAELSEFFVERFPEKSDAATVKAGVEAWLRLAAVLNQDAYYEFEEPVVKVGDAESHGVMAVKPKTGKGELRVNFKFKDGRLAEVASGGELVPGRRLR